MTGILTKTSYALFDVSGVKKTMLRDESMKNLTEIICIPVCVARTCIHLGIFSVVNFFLKFGFRIKMTLACK